MNDLWVQLAKTLHIPLLLGSFATFSAAFALGLIFLWQERRMKSKHLNDFVYRLPSLEGLDTLIYKFILVGLPLFTAGILLGSVWTRYARGRFWVGDPIEMWALVTWVVYASYLAIRFGAGWRGRKTTYLSLAGFALVMLTYVAVTYFSPLHAI
jgi:ABC-type transport system involved in cytochrome c biogenesis permease subunit